MKISSEKEKFFQYFLHIWNSTPAFHKKVAFYFIFICSMCVYLCETFRLAIIPGRIPINDEAHAWSIAGHFSILQIIGLMRNEGHFLLWYLFLKPFATYDLFYPTSMLTLNWLFMLGTILLIWFKAPFNVLTKTAITFSLPFFKIYPLLARCYAIGFFFLFLSMSIYKDRFKHPYWYLTTLVLCANTNIVMCFTSCIMGFVFLCELFATKASAKTITIVIVTALLNVVLWGFQFFDVEVPNYTWHMEPTQILKFFNLMPLEAREVTIYNVHRVLWVIFLLVLMKSKKTFFVAVSVLSCYLFLFLKVYTCFHVMHLWLSYIIALFLFWLYKAENRKSWLLEILFLLTTVYYTTMHKVIKNGYDNRWITDEKNITLILDMKAFPDGSPLPYLKRNNVRTYNLQGQYYFEYERIKYLYTKRKSKSKYSDPDKIAEIVKPGDLVILSKKRNSLIGNNYVIGLDPIGEVHYPYDGYHYSVKEVQKKEALSGK